MATRYIIGKAELLTHEIPPPKKPMDKAHPYSLADAKLQIIPQILNTAVELQELPKQACPADIAVAKVDLHPAYIAKSYFPTAFLREAGLTAIGSRTIRVKPRKDLRKKAPPESETTQLFVAGSRGAFSRLPSLATQLTEESPEALQFAEIEAFTSMTFEDRLRSRSSDQIRVFEVGLHNIPDQPHETLRTAFVQYAKECGFTANTDYEFLVGRMWFLALGGHPDGLEELAKFTLLRVVRPMPQLRSSRPFMRANPLEVSFVLPAAQPISHEPKVAILDEGTPQIMFFCFLFVEGKRPNLAATMGTSFAAPFALRTAVGIRAVLGDDVHPLTIKELLIHAAVALHVKSDKMPWPERETFTA